MGHSPKVKDAVGDKAEAEKELKAEIDRVRATLNNSEKEAIDYINSHTNGVIISADTKAPEIMFTNADSYSKFKEEYSLKALDGVIDGVIDSAKKGMEVAATGGDDPQAVVDLIGSVGGLIKSGLALASSSSSTTTDISVTFSQFSIGDKNFAVYNGINSGVVNASNVWGNKEITLIAQTSIIARVEPDPNLTYAEMLQDDLNALKEFHEDLLDQEREAIKSHNKDYAADLQMIKDILKDTETDIDKYRKKLYPELN